MGKDVNLLLEGAEKLIQRSLLLVQQTRRLVEQSENVAKPRIVQTQQTSAKCAASSEVGQPAAFPQPQIDI